MAIDVVGAAKVIAETVVDEASAKKAGEKIGDEVAKGVGDAGQEGGTSFVAKFGKAAGAIGLGAAIGGSLIEGFRREVDGARLIASLGLDGSEVAALNETASDIYKQNWGDSFEEVQTGVAAVKSSFASLNGAELEDAATAAQTFADVFQIDVVEAIGTASVAVKAGLAKDVVEAFDLMSAASTKVNFQFRDELQDSVTEYSTFAASVGLTGAEFFGILAAAGDQGALAIDKAGDAIKEFGLLATSSTPPVLEAFDTIGLDIDTMQAKLAQGGPVAGEAFKQIVDALNSIEDPLEQRTAAIALFGTPIEDLSQEKLPGFINALDTGSTSLQDFDGNLKTVGETASDTTSGQFAALGRSIKENVVNYLDETVRGFQDSEFAADRFFEQQEKHRERDEKQWEEFGENFTGFFEGQLDDLGGFFDNLGAQLNDFWDGLVENARDAAEAIKGFFSGEAGGNEFNGRSSNRGGNGQNVGGATGAQRWAGGLITVGETGREVVDLPPGSTLYPHRQSEMILDQTQQTQGTSLTYAPVFTGLMSTPDLIVDLDWWYRYGSNR